MKVKLLIAGLLATIALAAPASAAGSGDHSHNEMAIGTAGDTADVKRTIDIVMLETEDGEMKFEPATFSAAEGETLKLNFVNKGEMDHEFVMDTEEAILEHKVAMEKFPEMEHADPNAIRLAPGASGEIIWKFTKAGNYSFGCLIPGHYELGMKGDIEVMQK